MGDVEEFKFVAYYIDDKDRVIAVAGMNNSGAIMACFEAMNQNNMPKGSAIKSGAETPDTIKSRVKQNAGGSKCKRAGCCRKKSVA